MFLHRLNSPSCLCCFHEYGTYNSWQLDVFAQVRPFLSRKTKDPIDLRDTHWVTRRVTYESLIKEVDIVHDIYSDHRVVTCKLNFAKSPRSKILVTCRNNKTFDSDGFRLGLTDALSQLILDQDISVDTYNASLAKVYNAHFPLQTRWVTHRPCCAWYTSDLRAMKREKRQAERKFRKSRLEVHKQLFEASCVTYNSLLESTKCSYYTQKIESSNTKQLFRMIDGFFTARSPVMITDT